MIKAKFIAIESGITEFEQEFMAVPSEAQYNLLSEDLLYNAWGTPLIEGRETYLGWDIATSEAGDYTCFCVIERKEDTNQNHFLVLFCEGSIPNDYKKYIRFF